MQSIKILKYAIYYVTIFIYSQYVSTYEVTTMQCLNGFYLSKFSTAFDGNERFYKFGCTKFASNFLILDEKCTTTGTASTENGDIFLGCGNNEYTVGIQFIKNVSIAVDSWQLLCCKSDSINLRNDDCIDTKFINDYHKSSSFRSSGQIIKRWQAMPEKNDLRWWLQICPVDIIKKKPKSISEIRAKRQLPYEWSMGRFPAVIQNYNPFFVEHLRREEELNRQLFETSRNSINVYDQHHTIENSLSPFWVNNNEVSKTVSTSKVTPSRLLYRTKTKHYRDRLKSKLITSSLQTPSKSKYSEKPLEALDYYDLYDDNFDKRKHSEGGFLQGVSDFLQNLQDGLTLAQVAFPSEPAKNGNFHLKIEVTPPTTKRYIPNVMFSNDENNLQFGSFVQKKSRNKNKKSFFESTTTTTPAPKREVNTIEGMLQMIGLCQGHNDL